MTTIHATDTTNELDPVTAPSTATARLEHTNVTVSDPHRTAALLVEVFGWHVRWEGAAIDGGHTIHVGTEDDYLALYRPAPGVDTAPMPTSYTHLGGLNHIALVVDDLDDAERRLIAAGIEIGQHYDYEPGRRFYFRDHDGIEFEIVSYR